MKKPKYFDIHSHINFSAFSDDREEVIKRMREEGVWAIAVGTDLQTSKQVVELADKNKNIYATIGLHPDDNKEQSFIFEDYKELVKNKKVVAIGECGLDYFRLNGSEEDKSASQRRQKENFIKQIEFALLNDLPLMLHFRPSMESMDAYEEGLEILGEYKKKYGEKLRGNAHFFAGNTEIAKKFVEIGFTLSFTGVITFANNYNEIIKSIPLDMLMSETDCPFVAPTPYRGKRCEPVYVKEVVKRIAEIRNEDIDIVSKAFVSTAFRMFLNNSTI
jgi:TatD DNase family protein